VSDNLVLTTKPFSGPKENNLQRQYCIEVHFSCLWDFSLLLVLREKSTAIPSVIGRTYHKDTKNFTVQTSTVCYFSKRRKPKKCM
jgi:hypothetical protein